MGKQIGDFIWQGICWGAVWFLVFLAVDFYHNIRNNKKGN